MTISGKQWLYIIIGIVLLLIIIIIISNWNTLFPKVGVTTTGVKQVVPPSTVRATGAIVKTLTLGNDNFPLKKGSKGPKVADIQHTANASTNDPINQIKEDGIWGAKTEAQVLRSFATNIITVDTYNKYIYPYLSQIDNNWVGGSGSWDEPATDKKTSIFGAPLMSTST